MIIVMEPEIYEIGDSVTLKKAAGRAFFHFFVEQGAQHGDGPGIRDQTRSDGLAQRAKPRHFRRGFAVK